MLLDAPSAVLVVLFRVGSRPRNFVPKFWTFCPPISDKQPRIQQAASISGRPWLARQLPPGRSIDIFENKPEGQREKPDPTSYPGRGRAQSTSQCEVSPSAKLWNKGLIGSRFYLIVPQVTMAETSVPPPPPSTVSRPVSEALLNEKVRPSPERPRSRRLRVPRCLRLE